MIETDRLILRPYELADYESYCAMVCDVTPESFPSAQPISREEAWHRILRCAGHWTLLGFGLFAVLDKATRRYIGETGLSDVHRGMGADFDSSDEAGWYFVASERRRGYGFEAAEAAHTWHSGRREQERTVCMIDPENVPSQRLAAKLGYRPFREGVYKDRPVVMFERVQA
jgi:RimJ/RimL family protein N-acetyltransferase